MKYPKIIFLLIMIFFTFSCSKNDDPKISIFSDLFSDIHKNPSEYEKYANYIVKEVHPNNQFSWETEISVENEYFEIRYWPDWRNDNHENYVPQSVEIHKKTDEVILGKYIGESIASLFHDFIEIPTFSTYENIDWIYLSYGYNDKEINVGITVRDNIIIEIHYGYAM
jgi:hypothetical protein